MRRAAMNTPAAWNVRHGNPQETEYGPPPYPNGAGNSVPMMNMGGHQQTQGHPPEYYNVRPK